MGRRAVTRWGGVTNGQRRERKKNSPHPGNKKGLRETESW